MLSISIGFAQKRCATTEIHHQLQRKYPQKFDEQAFEKWISEKRSEKKQFHRKENEVYQIPVVVHVIHNGEEIGAGTNLSDEKIIEQINLLNKDFRRTNDDAINTPLEYQNVWADVEIEFVLAVRDPEGLPTTGITRTRGTKDRFKFSEDAILKSHINWPAEDYMNLYIADLQGFLGWAQFPVMNLDGLEGEFKTERLTDGVVLDYKYVGLNENTNNFESFGRTATHEIGHFLGLRHIWGDGGCSLDDYCEDTPFSNDDTDGCPSNKESCGSRDMIENFMDYTNDECMNLFTQCQKERMRIIMENSPRRKSLLSSNALTPPQEYTIDLGIRSINIDTDLGVCNSTVTPQLQVRNYGGETLDSFKIEMRINNVLTYEEINYTKLTSGEILTITFPQSTFSTTENNTITFEITEVNSGQDENPSNDLSIRQFTIPPSEDLPLEEEFEDALNAWSQYNFPVNNPYWQESTAPNESVNNTAYLAPYYSTNNNVYGNFDYLITPVVDLSSFNSTVLTFDYAYAPRPDFFTDGLIVAVSTDCGLSFKRENYLFERYGNQLATASSLDQEFFPISVNDWQSAYLDLSNYSDEENVRIAFIGVNGGGNNLFIDNVSIAPVNQFVRDVGIGEVNNISVLSCIGEFTPTVEVKNFGTEPVTSLEIQYRTRPNSTFQTASYDNFSIQSGKSRMFSLPDDAINNQSTILEVQVTTINDHMDDDDSNNHFLTNITINDDNDVIPSRERFEGTIEWTQTNSSGSTDWEIYDDSFNKSLFINGYNIEELGKENWLVSPVFDAQDVEEASMSFKVSYAQRLNRVDGLKVMVSNNCGLSWDHVVYNKQGSTLAIAQSNTEWIPYYEEDWRTEFIDLTAYLPENTSQSLRVAFVATNGNGNNIYIDDINIYNTSNPNLNRPPQEVSIYPNPNSGNFNVTMNLDKKEDIEIILTDIMGKVVLRNSQKNVLNQNFAIETDGLNGLYLLYLVGKNFEASQRVIIRR